MSDLLVGELTTIAFCWRVERRDGICLGFTSHDRDLEIGGLTYRASPGVTPSAVTLSDGFEADSLDLKGALSSDAITGGDLMAGRWDGAEVRLFMADWRDMGVAPLLIAAGEIGDVSTTGRGCEAELRGAAAALERPVAPQTSPECRAILGDRSCRVALAPLTRMVRVVAAADELVTVTAAAAGNAYAYGRLRWIGGANGGLESAIMHSDGPLLTLREPPPFAAAVGDLVEIREGCDKAFATCRDRFDNVANFRGEPHLPGIDLLTRYPGA
jgi:uncharacterized phage protein (TIGR02218 family)